MLIEDADGLAWLPSMVYAGAPVAMLADDVLPGGALAELVYDDEDS